MPNYTLRRGSLVTAVALVAAVVLAFGAGWVARDVYSPTEELLVNTGVGLLSQWTDSRARAAEERYEAEQAEHAAEIYAAHERVEDALGQAEVQQQRAQRAQQAYEDLREQTTARQDQLAQDRAAVEGRLRIALAHSQVGQQALDEFRAAWQEDYDLLLRERDSLLTALEEKTKLADFRQQVIDRMTEERTALVERMDAADRRVDELSGTRRFRWGPGVLAGFPLFGDDRIRNAGAFAGISFLWG